MRPVLSRLLGIGFAACVLAGCSREGGGGGGAGAAGPAASGGGPVAEYRMSRAERRLVERGVVATGSLLPQDQTPVSVRVAGRIESIAVDLGSVVRAGDLLAQVEAEDYRLRVRQAEAALGQARARVGLSLEGDDDRMDVEDSPAVKEARAVFQESKANRARIEELSRQGILPASEFETASAAFQVAASRLDQALEEARIRVAQLQQRRAELDIARKQLADTRIVAPFDGAVQERRANVGEYLSLGAPVVVLVRTDPLRLRVEVPEREAVRVRGGQSVEVRVEGDTNVYRGEVRRLSPAIREGSRTLVVEADVPARGGLRPGAFARARIVTVAEAPVVTVEPDAILSFAGVEKVFVVRDGKALETRVATGERWAAWVEVATGLSGGETVVLSPGSLQSGQPVREAAMKSVVSGAANTASAASTPGS